MKDIRDLMKEIEEEKMRNLLKEILTTKDQKNYIGNFDSTISFNYDSINEFLFVSLSNEDLKNVSLENHYEFEDVSIVDLQVITSYEINVIRFVNDILKSIIEDIRNEVEL